MLVFRELSSLAKCKVRKKTTPRQFVKIEVHQLLSDLWYKHSVLCTQLYNTTAAAKKVNFFLLQASIPTK